MTRLSVVEVCERVHKRLGAWSDLFTDGELRTYVEMSFDLLNETMCDEDGGDIASRFGGRITLWYDDEWVVGPWTDALVWGSVVNAMVALEYNANEMPWEGDLQAISMFRETAHLRMVRSIEKIYEGGGDPDDDGDGMPLPEHLKVA